MSRMTSTSLPSVNSIKAWGPALSGLCGLLVGVGFARFAYTPLLPALISAHWFSQGAAAYLGAANLAGYLAGAVLGHAMTRWVRARWLLRAMMLLTALSLLACERRELGFVWFFVWRFVSGYTGGAIMVVGAATIFAVTPPERRGLVGGTIFTGVGLGIAASGTLVPGLIKLGGLEGTWIGLGLLSLGLTILSWSGWPQDAAQPAPDRGGPPPARLDGPVRALLLEYGLNAVGLVPHMMFLVDYIARGLGRGLGAGGFYWVLFGIAAIAGPLLSGRLADRIGFRAALRVSFVIQAAAVAVPVLIDGTLWLALSTMIAGALTPGISTLTLGRVHDIVHGADTQRRVWAYATTAWALAQAAAAYGYAFLFSRHENYPLLFGLGVLALLLALVVDVAAAAVRRDRVVHPEAG